MHIVHINSCRHVHIHINKSLERKCNETHCFVYSIDLNKSIERRHVYIMYTQSLKSVMLGIVTVLACSLEEWTNRVQMCYRMGFTRMAYMRGPG